MGTIYVGDVGTVFRVTITENDVALDISSASVTQFKFQSPGGTTKTVDAEFYTDGTDGILQYAVVDGDLDEEGTWILQVYLETPSPWEGHSTQYKFKVRTPI